MSSIRNRIYWRLPYLLKCLAASWNSRRLDRERYGLEYRRVLAEILERDSWSAEQMARYQEKLLVEVVRQAALHVPYYRRLAIEPIRRLEDLARLPILEKQTARLHSADLVDERLKGGRLIRGFTSGTSGTPLTTYRNLATNAAHFAYWDARARGVAGLARRVNRGVVVSGQLVAAPDQSRPPYWVHNWPWKQLYMSSYHLSPGNMGEYLEAIRRFQPEFIEGYPSSLAALARHLLQSGQQPIPLKACFTTAETLESRQRNWIERAFLCPVTDQYGCCEFTMFAAECEAGSLHLSPEVGVVEILDENDRPVPVGQVGQVVVTGLANRTQLFLRYRIGDRAALSEKGCCCGRSLPVLKSLEGRTDRVLIASDGRRLGRLCHVFDDEARIAEAQIIQRAPSVFCIRVVPARGFSQRDADHLSQRLRDRVGREAEIDVVVVDEIPRGANGKFQAILKDF